MAIFDQIYFGNTTKNWALFFVTVLAFMIGLSLVRKALEHRLGQISRKTITRVDDLLVELISNTKFFFVFAWSVYLGTRLIRLPVDWYPMSKKVIFLLTMLQVLYWGNSVIRFLIDFYLKEKAAEDTALASTLGLFSALAKFMFFGLVFLLTLNNFGIDVTTLVAGLGVSGIAIAWAVQNILGDLFASLAIVLDKPFVVGDFIVVNELMGTVEQIGLKTTRLRSLSGEQLIFPNASLLQSRMRNFKRMYERRIAFSVNVVYDTPIDKLDLIPKMIKEIVDSMSLLRFERSHFKAYGPYALEFETVFWVLNPEYAIYMDHQQKINLEIHRRFKENKIEFAYPTQTILARQGAFVTRELENGIEV